MSLPKLTANIGKQLSSTDKNEFSAIIKNIKKVNEKEEPYVVFLTFDLPEDQIYIELDKKFNQDSINEYFYFGNNPAAASQYYLTREGNSIKYLLLSAYSDLYNVLKNNGMEEGELGTILKEIAEHNMITLSNKKGGGRLNPNKLSIALKDQMVNVKIDEKGSIELEDKKINADTFIRLFINDANKSNKFVLVAPKVILNDGEEIILPKHKDYLKVAKIENKLDEALINTQGEEKVCYICKKKKTDVSSSYTTKLSRIGINKIFQTKTKNYSPFLSSYNYDQNYSMCNQCYQRLKYGEKVIEEQFKGKIAGEDAFILPEALMQSLDYKYLNYLKESADLAFKSKNAKEWIDEIKLETLDIKNYCINFIIYRTDGNSVTVMETIEDVPMIRLDLIMKTIVENSFTREAKSYSLSLGSIYRLIPVKVNKKGEQIDIGRVLSFYKALLSGEKLSHKILFNYACEALDKGLRQLSKSKVDNYYNLNLLNYINGYEDFFIQKLIYSYIILIRTCQDLGVLNRDVLKFIEKEEAGLDNPVTPLEKVNASLNSIENFLDEQGFGNEERALFYLGILVNRVAIAQYLKEHRTKPILKKIQFQGMNKKDIYRLYNDVVEKLRQYDKMTLFSEAIMKKYHEYFGLLERESKLNDHANVFYLMAGYSYMVGTKPPDVTKEEEDAQKELLQDEENQ